MVFREVPHPIELEYTRSQFWGGRKPECPEETLEVRLRSTETQSTYNIGSRGGRRDWCPLRQPDFPRSTAQSILSRWSPIQISTSSIRAYVCWVITIHFCVWTRLNINFISRVVVKTKTVLLQMLVFVENRKKSSAILNFQNPSFSIKPLS